MGYKLTFAYDNRGNLTDVVDRDNGTTHYAYDDDSRMTSVTNPFDETTGYVYSPGGRVDKRLLANGCVTYYGYDEVGQVNLVDNRAPGLSVISSFAYERDARGNPTRITREDGSVVEYGYDAKSQLTSEVHKDPLGTTTDAWEWNYDLSGNRLYQIHNDVQTDYTYNLANQLLTETTDGVTTHYAYDRCGNTKSKQESAGTTHYHWDPENRLTQIDQPGNVRSYFSYDADGKRVTKEDSEGFTRFIYQGPDMLKLLQERDEEGNVTAHYTMGDGLESMRAGDDSRFYHYDWLGSTFELTNAAGAVTDSYLYDAWGNSLATTGTTPNPHRYVGRLRYYEMAGTGLYHVGHRELSTSAARFASVDTIADGLNWYAYANNLSTSAVDPTGLFVHGGRITGPEGIRQPIADAYVYTCKCGWLDMAHLLDTAKEARMMVRYLKKLPHVFSRSSHYDFRASIRSLTVSRPLSSAATMRTSWQFRWWGDPSRLSDSRLGMIGAYIAYRVRYQMERNQYLLGFSYEDLESNYLGAVVGAGILPSVANLEGACGPVSKADARQLFQEMSRDTYLGLPRHKRETANSAFPANPIADVQANHLFHVRYKSTKGMCDGISASGIGYPPRMYESIVSANVKPWSWCYSGINEWPLERYAPPTDR